jgi:hypothetical protein
MSNFTLAQEAIGYMRRLKVPEIKSSIIYIMGYHSPISPAGKLKYKRMPFSQAQYLRSMNDYK